MNRPRSSGPEHARLQDTRDANQRSATPEGYLRVLIDTMPGLVWSARPDGSIELLNQRWIDYTGLSLEQVQGWVWTVTDLIHPEDLPRLLATWRAVLASRQPGDAEARLRRFNGEYRWFLLRAVPVRDELGNIVRWYGTNTDIEDRKRAEALLAGENRLLEMLAQGNPLGLILDGLCRLVEEVSRDCVVSVLLLNPNDNRLWHSAAPSLPAGYIAALDGIVPGPCQGSCGTAAYRNEPVIVSDIATDPLWAGYRDIPLAHGLRACWSTPIRSSEGRVFGTLAIYAREPRCPTPQHQQLIEQITHLASIAIERTRTEAALRESEEHFRRMADSIPEVIWITALQPEQVLYASPSFERIWGLPVGDLYRNPRLWTETIHPEDRARVVSTFSRWVAGEEVSYHDVEFRIVQRNGDIRWVHERGVLSVDQKGKPCRASGIATDITERKRAEEALRRSEIYLAEAQRLSLTGSFGWDVSSGAVVWSDETFRITGTDRGTQPTLELVLERVHPEDVGRVRETLDRAARDGTDLEFEHRLLLPDGSVKHVHVWAHGVRDESSGGLEYLGAVMDVTATRRSQQALERAFDEIQALKDQLHQENVALREEIDKTSMFEEIVGASPALRRVLSQVAKVAPTDSTVLVTGETGTGKELVARAIHKRSARAARAFVSVHCAAVPPSLIASELFGHEKGAFTGAVQRRQGRFELAVGGTIFLDEIGELPVETQLALLRVLQEREFERVGGSRPIRADVRVIAATNRDLQAAVAANTFRADLFYRLNVFPLEVPPLRDRGADIPLLVEYFTHRYARRAGKKIRGINRSTLDLLQSYRWPGNIRELQNVIERAVIISETETLSVDEAWLAGRSREQDLVGPPLGDELVAHEKARIEAALKESRGRVSGPSGAAARLGVPRSTLESKIRSLRINKHRFRAS